MASVKKQTKTKKASSTVVGSGSSKRFSFKKINKLYATLAFVLVFGGIGSFLVFTSHADTVSFTLKTLCPYTSYQCLTYSTSFQKSGGPGPGHYYSTAYVRPATTAEQKGASNIRIVSTQVTHIYLGTATKVLAIGGPVTSTTPPRLAYADTPYVYTSPPTLLRMHVYYSVRYTNGVVYNGVSPVLSY